MSKTRVVLLVVFLILVFLSIFWWQSGQFVLKALLKNDRQELHVEQVKGRVVADFILPDLKGESFRLYDLKGKKIIVNFWASWCGPCKEEFPSLIKFIESSGGDVLLVAISLDDNTEDVKNFLSNYSYNSKYIFIISDINMSVAKQFGTNKLPESYIMDGQFVIQRKVEGSIDWMVPYMSEYIRSIK